MTRRHSQRRGYALILVMVFVVLFSAVLGVAWRRVVSALRVENVSEVRRQCDAGSIQVLAQAMKVLETCVRWSTDGATINGSTDATYKSQGANGQWYKIVFTRTSAGTANPAAWSVSVFLITDESALSLADLPTNPP